jgi:hypothetical protein
MTAPLTLPPLQRVCGWCSMELAPGRLPVTTGICPACYVRLEHEDQRRRPGGVQ